MNTREKIAVMQAFVDGKAVEIRVHRPCNLTRSRWRGQVMDATSPSWDWFNFEYRIKPEPEVVWVNKREGCRHLHATEEAARGVLCADNYEYIAKKFVEVL